jgi:hypothetical protein
MRKPANPRQNAGLNNKQLSLLPEPPFSPKWPNPSTLAHQVLTRLLNGEQLTQVSFGFHSWRLSAHIKELDYLGWPIDREDVSSPNRERSICEYWLDPEIISKVGLHHGRR